MLGFTGPFGDTNYGDYAMFVNDVVSLNIKEITVFCYNVDLLERLEKSCLKNFNITKCKVEVDYLYKPEYTEKYHTEYDDKNYTPLEIVKLISNIDEVRNAMQKVDKLIVCGGGYFNQAWNAKHRKAKLFSIMGAVLAANELNKEIFFLGNTFGPFNEGEQMFAEFFASLKNAKIAVRDFLFSVGELRKIGYTKQIEILPNDLYFCDYSSENIYKNRLDDYIIIECYSSIDEIKCSIEITQKFVNEVGDKYGYKVVFLPLGSDFGGEKQAKLIKEKVENIIILDDDVDYLSIEKVQSLISGAKFVFSQRYHLFLTALSMNVPCMLALKEVLGDYRYYYCKVKGLLEQVFSNQKYDEKIFVCADFLKSLNDLEDKIPDIILRQSLLYNPLKEEAERIMKNKRLDYLNMIKNS